MGYIRLEKDSDGIIDFIFDQPGKTVNTMGIDYQQAMDEAMVEVCLLYTSPSPRDS